LAGKKGIPLRVVLFESKDFSVDRNICVGVLSPPFRKLLEQLGLTLPERIVQRRIKGYMLHSKSQTAYLEEVSQNDDQTMVVDRSDLDSLLLAGVQKAGGTVISDAVVDIRKGPDKVLVVGSGGARVLADAVVGAFGLNHDSLSIFESHVPGFRRPNVTKSILTDIAVDPQFIDVRLNNIIHALLIDQLPRVEFGAVTPKRDHITVNIAGDNISDDDLDAFLRLPWSRKLVREATFKEPRYYDAFPSAPARNFFSDRIVTIGNTSGLLRPLKGKGINTGLITGMAAAKTMMDVGISKHAFSQFYRDCQHITDEFAYGRFLRRLYRLSQRLDVLDTVLELAGREPLLYRAFYDMVSGEGSYKDVVLRSARPRLALKLVDAIVRDRFRAG
jgi:flavin-dependent dehydrogenase